jgi:hypothetical protein
LGLGRVIYRVTGTVGRAGVPLAPVSRFVAIKYDIIGEEGLGSKARPGVARINKSAGSGC